MPRSGELLRVKVLDAVMVILGPKVPIIGRETPPAGISYSYPVGTDSQVDIMGSGFLFDDVTYTIQISASTAVEVMHANRPMDLTWVRHTTHHLATTTWQFHQVGWTEIRLGTGGVRVKILSRKMDYETDYQMMVQDLENQVRGLTAKLISSVLSPMMVTEQPFDLWSYWLAILKQLWIDLAHDLVYAWHTLPPHLRTETASVFIDRQRKIAPRDLRRYMATGNTRIATGVRRWDGLTPERLYLLQLLQYLHRRLQRVFQKVPHLAQEQSLVTIAQEAARLLRNLRTEVGVERVVGEPQIPVSPMAESHSALRRVVRGHRLLQMGLFPDAGSYLVGPKDISLLYEYWCYLTIVRLVVEESHGELKVSPVVSSNPVDILLSSGKDHAAEVKLAGGRTIEILYERQFQSLPTVTQKPDHVVQLKGMDTLVVFDAKYRFELDDRAIDYYGKGSPIPPVSTINGMHQYHDAIVMRHAPHQRLVDRAIVLFPLPNAYVDTWDQHRFFKSIESVGVGALPLLPGGTDIFLRREIRRYVSGLDP